MDAWLVLRSGVGARCGSRIDWAVIRGLARRFSARTLSLDRSA